jgi:hypothetical protein
MSGVAGQRFQVGGDFLPARQVMQARRRAGDSFDSAWAHAMKMVSREDRAVLEETKGAWAAGYNRQSFYSGAAFGTLDGVTDEHHDTARQLAV